MKPERSGPKWRDPTLCELRPDLWQRRYTNHKCCVGTVIKCYGIKLCLRHRKLVAEIAREASHEKCRHPVSHKSKAAA